MIQGECLPVKRMNTYTDIEKERDREKEFANVQCPEIRKQTQCEMAI